MSTGSPASLRSALVRLRWMYLGRQALEIAAIALALDLAMDGLSFLLYRFLRLPLRTEFFFETLLVLLLARAVLRTREGAFAAHLDRAFALKDRLKSFLEYSRDARVPAPVREAQASECLRSIDFPRLGRRLRPRIHPSMYLTLPLFLGLMVFYSTIDGQPAGLLGRTVVGVFSPAGGGGRADGSTASGATDAVHGGAPGAPQATGTPESTQAGGPGALPDAGDGKGLAGPSVRTLPEEDASTGPREIKSFPVTEEVSEVGPSSLAAGRGVDLSEIQPENLLGLIPWPKADTSLDMAGVLRDYPFPDPASYPAAYREHIASYFREFETWQNR